jgi:hypothetical protein
MTKSTRIVLVTLAGAGVVAALLLIPATRTGAQVSPGPGPFDLTANHYHCYQIIEWDNFQPTEHRLTDQFRLEPNKVLRPRYLCNPTRKDLTGIVDPDLHYVCYEVLTDFDPEERKVLTKNQYGEATLKTYESELLCLPSKKEEL